MMDRGSHFLFGHKLAVEIAVAVVVVILAIGLFIGGVFAYLAAKKSGVLPNVGSFYVGVSSYSEEDKGQQFTFELAENVNEDKRIVTINNDGDTQVAVTISVQSQGASLQILIADADVKEGASEGEETFTQAAGSKKDYYIFISRTSDDNVSSEQITVTVTLKKSDTVNNLK